MTPERLRRGQPSCSSRRPTSASDLGDDVVVARALHNLVRTDTRPRDAAVAREQLERMRAAAERVGFDSMAGAAHAQGLADLAEWEGDLGGRSTPLADGRRVDRGYLLTDRGLVVRACTRPASPSRPATSSRPPPSATSWPAATGKPRWFVGLGCHVACRIGDLPAAAAGAAPALAELGGSPGGAARASLVHDVVSAALRGRRRAARAAAAGRPRRRPARRATRSPPTGEARRRQGARRGAAGRGRRRPRGGARRTTQRAGGAENVAVPVGAGHRPRRRRPLRSSPSAGSTTPRTRSPPPRRLLARWGGWRVDGARGGPPPPRRRRRRRRARGAHARGSGRSSPSSPRGSPTPSWPAACSSRPKTAAVHVSNVLAKLGMASRTEVAAWAIREGIAHLSAANLPGTEERRWSS